MDSWWSGNSASAVGYIYGNIFSNRNSRNFNGNYKGNYHSVKVSSDLSDVQRKNRKYVLCIVLYGEKAGVSGKIAHRAYHNRIGGSEK